MSLRQRKSFKALAVFVAFAVVQISIQMSFASTVQQQLLVKISTSGNRPIMVNGNSTPSGGSLATGATIETPDGVSATIDLGALGTLDIAPNSKVVLEFDCPPAPPTGDDTVKCVVKAKVLAGCAVLKTNAGTYGQIDSEVQEKVQESPKGGSPLNFCAPGATGTSTSSSSAGVGGGAGGGGGVSGGAIAAGAVAAGVLAAGLFFAFTGGSNPSPST